MGPTFLYIVLGEKICRLMKTKYSFLLGVIAKLCTEMSELYNLNLKFVSKTLNNCQFLSRLELPYVIIRFPRVVSE